MNAYHQVMNIHCSVNGENYDMVLVPDFITAEIHVIQVVPFFKFWTRKRSYCIKTMRSCDVDYGKILPNDLKIVFEEVINKYVKNKIDQKDGKEYFSKVWQDWRNQQ